MHFHRFDIKSEYSGIHLHQISNYVKYPLGVDFFHVHMYLGISSYLDHAHYYSGITSGPIKTENGHIHMIDSTLQVNRGHKHSFRGYTDEEVSYNGKGIFLNPSQLSTVFYYPV